MNEQQMVGHLGWQGRENAYHAESCSMVFLLAHESNLLPFGYFT